MLDEKTALRIFMRKIKAKLQDRIPVATGKMRKSINYRIKDKSAELYGHPYLLAVETGRGKFKGGEIRGLADALEDWMNAVGYTKQKPKQLAFLINKYGTRKPKDRDGMISKFEYESELKELMESIGRSKTERILKILEPKIK